MEKHKETSYREGLKDMLFKEALKQEYQTARVLLQSLDKQIAMDEYPAYVGEKHGELIKAQYATLQSLVNILHLRLLDLNIRL